jgi:hypothetical protein
MSLSAQARSLVCPSRPAGAWPGSCPSATATPQHAQAHQVVIDAVDTHGRTHHPAVSTSRDGCSATKSSLLTARAAVLAAAGLAEPARAAGHGRDGSHRPLRRRPDLATCWISTSPWCRPVQPDRRTRRQRGKSDPIDTEAAPWVIRRTEERSVPPTPTVRVSRHPSGRDNDHHVVGVLERRDELTEVGADDGHRVGLLAVQAQHAGRSCSASAAW